MNKILHIVLIIILVIHTFYSQKEINEDDYSLYNIDQNKNIHFKVLASSECEVLKFKGQYNGSSSHFGFDYFDSKKRLVAKKRNYRYNELQIYEYDSNDSIKEINYLKGAPICRTIYKCYNVRNENGRLIRSIDLELDQQTIYYKDTFGITDWYRNKIKTWRVDYENENEYENNLLIKIKSFPKYTSQTLYTFEYDSLNRKTLETSYLYDSTIYYRQFFYYDSLQTTAISKTILDKEGDYPHPERKKITYYNSKGYKIKEVNFSGGKFFSKNIWYYNSKNLLEMYEIYNTNKDTPDLGYIYKYSNYEKPKVVIKEKVVLNTHKKCKQ